MGIKLVRLFEQAGAIGGLVARMRLASMSQVTSMEAEAIDDHPDRVARVQNALDEIRKQFATLREEKPAPQVVVQTGDNQIDVLRRYMAAYLDLMAQRSLFLGDTTATVRRVNEAGSTTLDVQRMSVWFCDADQSKIACADLFERQTGRHSSGIELSARDYAPYFRALRGERTIAAHDARSDPRTSCFSKGYLEPLGIYSLLDVPIWVGRKMVGVVCHEQIGAKRMWTQDDETFAYLMSHFVTLTLERREPKSNREDPPSSVRLASLAHGALPRIESGTD
jgi:GAF domain-containing protein